ncbi:ABC transporter substrate-binding protein [Comamonadaceae bacterium G21597-S1]|nr:ABC transporter substrate-binding protein [Comamonadaceae bacterium G21597-S1]
MTLFKQLLGAAAIVLAATTTPPVRAADSALIGVRTETQSIDPHFSYVAPSKAAAHHIFDALIMRDADLQLTPALAVSWTHKGGKAWEIKLRPNVKWHDGKPFTAQDVLFTFERAGKVPNSPAPFGQFLSQIEKVVASDDLTLQITTRNESPQLLYDLAEIPIVSRHAGLNASTDDYNSGKAAIGTGPFRFVSWKPGGALELERNDDYFGAKAGFKRLSVVSMPNDASRMAALLAGSVDLIDSVPPDAMQTLKKDARFAVWQIEDVYATYLHMDTSREKTPFIRAKDGSEIRNPLLDPRVRQALSLAINRAAIIDRLLYGMGVPAGQLAAPRMHGFNPALKPAPFDARRARALLAEAGYPNGFQMTIHGPNNRYVADAAITQAVAQMFEQIGISMKVETMPSNVFFTRGSAQEFSIFFIAWGSAQGTASHGLRGVLMTYDKARGYGPSNRGRYSNAKVDELTIASINTFKPDEAARLAREAAAIAFGENGIIPLHYQVNVWAGKAGLTFVPRSDQMTLGQGLAPKN